MNYQTCTLLHFLVLHERGRSRSGEGWTYFGRQHCLWECTGTQVLLARNQSVSNTSYKDCIKWPTASAFTCYYFCQAAFQQETSFSCWFCYSFITFKGTTSYLCYSNTASQPSTIILQVQIHHHTKMGMPREYVTFKTQTLSTTLPLAYQSSDGVRKQQQTSGLLIHILWSPFYQPFNIKSNSSLKPRIGNAVLKFPGRGRALQWQDQKTFVKGSSRKYTSLITDHLPRYLRK